MKDKFKGFDQIHAKAEWKEELLAKLEQPRTHQRRTWKLALVVALFVLLVSSGMALTYVVAQHDDVKQWLHDLFSTSQEESEHATEEKPESEDAPEKVITPEAEVLVSDYQLIELSNSVCWIDRENYSYVDVSCGDMKQKDSYTVKHISGEEHTIQKQHMEVDVTFEGESYPIRFDYVDEHGKLFWLEPEERAETGLIQVRYASGLGHKVILMIKFPDALNEYILDMDSKQLTSIGDERLQGDKTDGNTKRNFAYDTHVSEQGSYVLFRCGMVNGVWVNRKENQNWIVKNMKTGEEVMLDRAEAGIVSNEISFVDDTRILTTEIIKVTTFYPIVYDCESKIWTMYDDYDYADDQQFTNIIKRQNADSYTLLDLKTMEKTTIAYPFAKKEYVQPYTYYDLILKDANIKAIYVRKLNRFIRLEYSEDMEGIEIRFVSAINDHQFLINFNYLITFAEEK